MDYIGKMWRPPSEANSLILQITVGCSHNKCRFCNMYKEKEFQIKKEADIIKNINDFKNYYQDIERVFLADGDALIVKFDKLLNIIKNINKSFKNLKRISSYGTPQSILNKSLSELKKLRENGLKMIYLGIESGSDQILSDVKKGATRDQIIKAGKKLKKAGIINSSTIILGLGGENKSKLHAVETASIINEISPDYLSALTLMLTETAPMYKDYKNNKFKPLKPYQAVVELSEMLKRVDLDDKCVFRSNHASNYFSIKGTLPEDKEKIIKKLKYIINNPKEYNLKPENNRRL